MKKWQEAEIAYGYLLQQSKIDGLDFDAVLTRKDALSLGYQKGSLDNFSRSRSLAIGIRVIRDGKVGSSYTEDLSTESLKAAYYRALEVMEVSEPAPYVELTAPYELPELTEIHNPELKNVDVERKMELARTLEATAFKVDARITSVPYGGYSESESRHAYFNSKEFFAWYQSNGAQAGLYPLAKDESGDAQMGKALDTQRSFEAFNPVALAEEAAAEALSRLGAEIPASGNKAVLLRNDTAQTFLGLFGQMFSGQDIFNKTSPLAKFQGQNITAGFWTFTDDPFYHGGFHSRPMDGEGQRSQVTPLVKNGQVAQYLTDRRAAHLLGVPSTASSGRTPYSSFAVSASNLVVRSENTESRESLLARHPETVEITSLNGLAGYNKVSGDFSIESEGNLYRNGEKVAALKNFLVTGNLIEALGRIEAFGDDLLMDSSAVITPSVLISELTVAGK